MALVCDYCGDVTEATERVSVAFGHDQEIALKGATAQEWFYYCEGECADTVKASLENMRLYALHGDEAGLMWQLVSQNRAPEAKDVQPVAPPAEVKAAAEAAPSPVRPRPADKAEDGEPLWKTNPEVAERAGRLPLSWFLKKGRSDRPESDGEGVPVAKVVKHQASKGNLWNQGIITLEDAAELTEAEFMGLPGVGQKVFNDVSRGMKAHGLEFREGPSLDQLGRYIRDQRETAGLDIDDMIPIVLNALDAPETRTLGGEDRSKAHWHVEALLRSCENGSKGAPPQVLDVLAETLGADDRAALLGGAAEVCDPL